MIKRIGLLTSGGDAPGMNAAIRSVVRYGLHHKLEVIGILRGYAGLIDEELKPLDHLSVAGIINRGGTILESARSEDFVTEEGQRHAMERIFVVEVMGRECGFILIQVALAAGAEEVLVPELGYDLEEMHHDIEEGHKRGKFSWIIVVAEGAAKGEEIAKKITKMTGLEIRADILGHIQRVKNKRRE